MNRDLLNILSESNKDIDNQMLMDYLSGTLRQDEQHLVEEWLVDNPFAADAMEGLQSYSNKDDLRKAVNQLNLELKQYLQSKRDRREKRRWKDNPVIYLAVGLILVLVVVAYYLIKLAANR